MSILEWILSNQQKLNVKEQYLSYQAYNNSWEPTRATFYTTQHAPVTVTPLVLHQSQLHPHPPCLAPVSNPPCLAPVTPPPPCLAPVKVTPLVLHQSQLTSLSCKHYSTNKHKWTPNSNSERTKVSNCFFISISLRTLIFPLLYMITQAGNNNILW